MKIKSGTLVLGQILFFHLNLSYEP